MSARGGPSGTSNRADLFSSARKVESNDASPERNEFDLEDDDQNPLQIDHVMGYAGDYPQTILALNSNENTYVKSLGCLVLVESLLDPHDQKLLRGHDMEVLL